MRSYVVTFCFACVMAALLSSAVLVPGWVWARGALDPSALAARIAAAGSGLFMASTAAMAAIIPAAFVSTSLMTVLGSTSLLAFAGGAGLGPVRAHEADPRTADAAPPRVQAVCQAVGGALGAWSVVGVLWALGAIKPPWWSDDGRFWWAALLVGPFVAAATAFPCNLLAARYAAAAGRAPPSPPVLWRRAAACCAVLRLLAAMTLVRKLVPAT